jgi:P4 family phage/plasmid primase-like protien
MADPDEVRRKVNRLEEHPALRAWDSDAERGLLIEEAEGAFMRFWTEYKEWVVYHNEEQLWIVSNAAAHRKAEKLARRWVAALDQWNFLRDQLQQSLPQGSQVRLPNRINNPSRLLRSVGYQRQALTHLQDAEAICTHARDWDADPLLLGVQGGVLDFSNRGKVGVRDPHPRYLMTKRCNAKYDPTVRCKAWEDALKEWMEGDEERVHRLQLMIGSGAVGQFSSIATTLNGAGRNGKTVFCNASGYVLGSYVTVLNSSVLLASNNGSGPQPELARLRGARLVFLNEWLRYARLNSPLFKNLTGGDPITADAKFKDPITFDPTWTIVLRCNHLPVVDPDDYALWARFSIVPWNQCYPKGDDAWGEQFHQPEAATGILTWIVEGAREYLDKGLGRTPQAIVDATNEYHLSQDAFRSFVGVCCTLGNSRQISQAGLRTAYEDFTGEHVNARAFGVMLRKRQEDFGYIMPPADSGRPITGISLQGATVKEAKS